MGNIYKVSDKGKRKVLLMLPDELCYDDVTRVLTEHEILHCIVRHKETICGLVGYGDVLEATSVLKRNGLGVEDKPWIDLSTFEEQSVGDVEYPAVRSASMLARMGVECWVHTPYIFSVLKEDEEAVKRYYADRGSHREGKRIQVSDWKLIKKGNGRGYLYV